MSDYEIIDAILLTLNNNIGVDVTRDFGKVKRQSNLELSTDTQRRILNLLSSKNLARIDNSKGKGSDPGISLTTEGSEIISEFGSYSNFRLRKDLESERDSKIKDLTLDKLEYERTIQEQNKRILYLTEKLNHWSLLKNYWWFLGIILTFGLLIEERFEIIQQLIGIVKSW